MNTDELKKVITKNIKANGRGEITGPVLQSVLVDMVNGLQTDGLGFLGIINPGDPAPSNEKVNGYYLSFTVNNPKYSNAGREGIPTYFNGAKLNRYCMFIWTQDENGSWKFKRIKYDDHKRKDGIVIGRGLPIWYLGKGQGYQIHLSPDGTMMTYAVCGFSPLRKVEDSMFKDVTLRPDTCLFFQGQRGGEKFPEGNRHRGYQIIKFNRSDDGRVFGTRDELWGFLETRKTSIANTLTASPNYTIISDYKKGDFRILWTPQTFRRPVYFKRVARNQSYFDATSKWASRRDTDRNWWISWRMCFPKFDDSLGRLDNGIIRDSKRKNNTEKGSESHYQRWCQRGGTSDNFIVFSNGSPKLPL